MEQAIAKIGIREFRNYLSKYLATETLAVTNHGKTVGYYIPVHFDGNAADAAALQQAAGKMAAILAQHNLTEEDIVADYRLEREGRGAE